MENFKGKKVLILGLGVNQGGVGSAKFFAEHGADVLVTDLKSEEQLQTSLDQLKDLPNIRYVLGKHNFEDIDWADIVIRNQALRPNNEYRLYAEKTGKEVETDVGIFLQFVKPSQIIGVTGTKGKSTTSSLIYEVLKSSLPVIPKSSSVIPSASEGSQDKPGDSSASPLNDRKINQDDNKVVFAGNIGKSVLDAIEQIDEETLVVLEISSFQLEAFEKHGVSPHWAVITNIYPDHLNYYSSMEEYVESKRVIAKNQSENDFLFLKKGDEYTNSDAFLKNLKAQIQYFSGSDLPKNFQPSLPGEHNKDNIAATLKVAENLDIKAEDALETMKNFKGVEFRLQLIKESGGIKIYNDTAATTPDAATQAVKSLPNSIVISGGMNKGLKFTSFAHVLDDNAKMVFFLEGDASEEIMENMDRKDKIKGVYDNFEELLEDVKIVATEGDVVLFTPGATSFNLFQNEFDRGRKFNEAVGKIFNS